MRSPFRFFYVTLAFCFILESNTAFAEETFSIFRLTQGTPYARIPFQLIQNMIILPVTLNGQQELNFILDTGTRTPVILNKKTIKSLELHRGRNISFSGVGAKGIVSGFAVHDITLELQGVKAAGISAVVLEENHLRFNKLNGIEIHGIVGASLFYSLVVHIDYPNQIIELIDKSNFYPCTQYTSMEMQIIDSKPIIQAEVHIEDEMYETNLFIDTGFNQELLIKSGTPVPHVTTQNSRLGWGVGGLVIGKTGKVDHLQLNTLKIPDVKALFPTAKSYPSNTLIPYHGTIGNGLLKQYNIILDYAGEMLYIKSSPEKERVVAVRDWKKIVESLSCTNYL